MKSSIFSSASSSKLPPAAATASLSGGGSRDRPAPATGDSSCYFPGCRKDTNCHCEICLASINATLDLIPSSSSITKVSYLRSKSKSTPQQQRQRPSTAADPAMPATPPASPVFNRSTSSSSLTPPMESTAKSRPPAREVSVKKKRSGVSLTWALILLLCFSLLVFLDLGFLKGLLEGFGPRLTREMVNQIGEESRVFSGDLKGKVRILELKIGALVGEGVSNCSSLESKWEMDQVTSSSFLLLNF
ncbi:hypothetical protein AXF42_Ash012997 [Apostasia shenzhenica]|uniref:Uncharacterized protein n=1 Tax=Apostasia shenzhenica TaxID=1088818 RepID=A0A2I0ARU9_9ASPA|nr:hypothetical protein AXF42_Ash012997 [Apostasia shenzhenica]